jgi:hypothetical protein
VLAILNENDKGFEEKLHQNEFFSRIHENFALNKAHVGFVTEKWLLGSKILKTYHIFLIVLFTLNKERFRKKRLKTFPWKESIMYLLPSSFI